MATTLDDWIEQIWGPEATAPEAPPGLSFGQTCEWLTRGRWSGEAAGARTDAALEVLAEPTPLNFVRTGDFSAGPEDQVKVFRPLLWAA